MNRESKPTLYGADYSVYVRIARLTLAEKHIDYDLVPVDIFADGGPPDWYGALHPFSKIPAFEHDGLRLFETTAIARYVDEAFDGPALQPSRPHERAVMNQIVGLLDAYAYRTLVWDIYVETVSKPREGKTADDAVVSAALLRAETCLATLTALKAPGPWLLGEQLTLADLHAAPMFGYFMQAEASVPMLARHPALFDWWQSMQARESFPGTSPTS
ncbi:glutathione S-transferase family protein [Mesorhizobium sp. 1M-11]|uniref:glutathione S-transferase family protein n=1 Tax=Mesorhizobium sp. 1M-11 TaxID=1529006 RepID=UPI0006C743C5|nr:glutathione S-transferase family protein [Mesorhizobium sp. 1M-11]